TRYLMKSRGLGDVYKRQLPVQQLEQAFYEVVKEPSADFT
ncbi:hypothetical protein ACFMKD_21620, partial [Acinetobacter baumannii]